MPDGKGTSAIGVRYERPFLNPLALRVTLLPAMHPICAVGFSGTSAKTTIEEFMRKTVFSLLSAFLLSLSFVAFAQSGDNMKQDNMKQDEMKHDQMSNDQMKHDEMKKDKKSKKTKKDKMKKDEMKKDEMKKDDNMKHDEGTKQN